MKWYIADSDYVNAMQRIDDRVQNNYTGTSLKPYLGIILEVGNYKYYVPVSSPKCKHNKMRDNIDFIKVLNRDGTRLLCVLNLNNMIPIPDHCITKLEYSKIESYKKFASLKEKDSYVGLLRDELKGIKKKREFIRNAAEKLHAKRIQYPDSGLAKRCCDFQKLEAASDRYMKQE